MSTCRFSAIAAGCTVYTTPSDHGLLLYHYQCWFNVTKYRELPMLHHIVIIIARRIQWKSHPVGKIFQKVTGNIFGLVLHTLHFVVKLAVRIGYVDPKCPPLVTELSRSPPYSHACIQERKPGGKFGGGAMTDCFRVQTSYSQNWPCWNIWHSRRQE